MIEPVLAKTDAANVFTATQQIKSTDAGATAGPTLELYRDSASPAAGDDIGQIPFQGRDSAGNLENYARIKAVITDPTSTSEDAKLVLQTIIAGTLAASYQQNTVRDACVPSLVTVTVTPGRRPFELSVTVPEI